MSVNMVKYYVANYVMHTYYCVVVYCAPSQESQTSKEFHKIDWYRNC